MPIFGTDHPQTSITVKINQLSKAHFNEDLEDDSLELRISDLIHLIKIQPNTGAVEAARAIRKKVKYGEHADDQLLALQILELLVLNGGTTIGGVIARDDKLNELLRAIVKGHALMGNDNTYPGKVISRARAMALGWRYELAELSGFEPFSKLYVAIPRAKRVSESRPGHSVGIESDSGFAATPSTPRIPPPRPKGKSPFTPGEYSTKQTDPARKQKKKKKKKSKYGGIIYADEQYKIPQINYGVEAPKIRSLLSDCHTHATALDNSLTALARDESPLDNPKTSKEFEKCRAIRHKILRYLQFVGAGDEANKSKEVLEMDEEFLGSLIGANEKLVQVFKRFDHLCGYTEENPAPNYDEDDSDESFYSTEDEEDEDDEELRDVHNKLQQVTVGSSTKSPPPQRPAKQVDTTPQKPPLVKAVTNETISSDPFGDGNAVKFNKSVYE
jgi:hypothetical protein